MRHRSTGALLAAAASALLLTGCGGTDDQAPAASSSADDGSAAGGGSGAGGDSGAADVEYDTIAVPEEFGGGEIPVPPGLTPGEPEVVDGAWRIEVDGIAKEDGVAFYRDALLAQGYTLDLDQSVLVQASDDARTVTASLSPGPDGVWVTVEPSS